MDGCTDTHAEETLSYASTSITVAIPCTVTAASDWNAPFERKRVRPALKGSYEALSHESWLKNFLLIFQDESNVVKVLRETRLERAIGVIYLPQTERASQRPWPSI